MQTLKQKHKIFCDLITVAKALEKLNRFYDRAIKRAKNTPYPLSKGDFGEQVSEIVQHLNQLTGLAYRESSHETRSLIKARLNEKFTVEDFKKVHIIKTKKWLNNDNRVVQLLY